MGIEKKKVDCVVIGGGPGGYPAAIRLAQGGKKVLLVEAKELGGVCLNCGCIPTKSYQSDAKLYHMIGHAHQKGISVKDVQFDWKAVRAKKDGVVKRLRTSLTSVIQSHGIEIMKGYASFLGPKTVQVSSEGKILAEIEADTFVIASGSEPKEVKAFPFDGALIHSSTTMLDCDHVPESLLIVGGGSIGCEFASLFRIFGAEIIIVEALDRIMPLECKNLSKALTKAFHERGITVKTGVSVKSIRKEKGSVHAEISDGTVLQTSAALISIGRVLNVPSDLGLHRAGVQVEKGAIVVDDAMRTSQPHIWAVGDVTGKALYAHVATHQGMIAADAILGHEASMRYDAIPGVVFSLPQIASVGLSYDSAKSKGLDVFLTSYPMQAIGRAQAAQEEYGFAQMVVEQKTGRIVGAQVVGGDAETLIAEMITAIANELTVECIGETIHPHPTYSEIWMECAFMAMKKPLHFMKQMK